MRRMAMVLVLTGGFFNAGCTAGDAALEYGKRWWENGGKEKAMEVAGDVARREMETRFAVLGIDPASYALRKEDGSADIQELIRLVKDTQQANKDAGNPYSWYEIMALVAGAYLTSKGVLAGGRKALTKS